MVRSGIAIYGLHPSAEAPLPEGFRPALTWKARLASVKDLPAGHGIGYNYRYTTGGQVERIGVIPVGYADGFRRRWGNFVLVGGSACRWSAACAWISACCCWTMCPARVLAMKWCLGRQGER
jgi:alanine racemase